MIAVPSSLTPKHKLLGVTLSSGWKIVNQLHRTPGATGGNFGVGYIAQKADETAFVKAVDFVDAMGSADPMGGILSLASDATFEKEVLEYCTARGMSHVLRYFGSEYVFTVPGDIFSQVFCLVMEVGQKDLRRERSTVSSPSCVWVLKVMSDVSLALAQLHRGGISHQDLKPSNVISVGDNKSANQVMKIGDLGRVTRRDRKGPFDAEVWPGDPSYTPPEIWYGHLQTDWNDKREAADAYMLGSLLVFLCTGATIQSLISTLIPKQYFPGTWGGSFDKDLIPVLQDCHARVLEIHVRPTLWPEIVDETMKIAQELTHPDPQQRGDRRARREVGRSVGMGRIHQRIHSLYLRASAIERGRSAK